MKHPLAWLVPEPMPAIARAPRHALPVWARLQRLPGLLLWALLLGLAAPALQAQAPAEHLPAFKGSWQGPSERLIPGPGPKPGQSLGEYFASLPTGSRQPQMPRVLVLGRSTGFHHDSVTPAMVAVAQAGRRSGQWQAELRTDFELINSGGGAPMRAGFQPQGLKDFDAIVVASASGDWGLSPAQRAAFISFVREAGKGLVVLHAGLDANAGWRDYLDLVGGQSTGHPFNTPERVLRPFPLVNEAPDFPATRHWPAGFVKQDELYVLRNWSRQDVRVLLRMNLAALDSRGLDSQLPPDRDVPVAWAKQAGQGRVFATTLGHHAEAYDDPELMQMISEGLKWVLGLVDGDATPRPAP